MNDKELANKVVALGVGRKFADPEGPFYAPPPGSQYETRRAEVFVRDWRVAGALMEKLESYDGFTLDQSGDDAGICLIRIFTRDGVTIGQASNGNMIRAIIEACVEALS